MATDQVDIFDSAEWYDRGINWDARLGREVPVLCEVFGPPPARPASTGGLLDAGCGSGRHLVALGQLGYRVTGLDRSEAMLQRARVLLAEHGLNANLVEAPYTDAARAGSDFGGVFCLGNALAAVGRRDEAHCSIAALASVLRPGGRLLVQVLNFAKLRDERPAVRGPRLRQHGDREYVSTRIYAFAGEQVEVTNVTLWREGGTWRQHAHAGTLCAISREDLIAWCRSANLTVEQQWGGYDRQPFDPHAANDLIVVAQRI